MKIFASFLIFYWWKVLNEIFKQQSTFMMPTEQKTKTYSQIKPAKCFIYSIHSQLLDAENSKTWPIHMEMTRKLLCANFVCVKFLLEKADTRAKTFVFGMFSGRLMNVYISSWMLVGFAWLKHVRMNMRFEENIGFRRDSVSCALIYDTLN